MRLRFIKPGETHALRQLVLRPAQPLAEMEWPLDRAADSFHVGLETGEGLVSIATFIRERHEQLHGRGQYRLRGMATAAGHRGQGYASALLRFGVEQARQRKADLVWCNAREGAVGFYAREGFRADLPPFLIDGIGMHQLMHLQL